MPATVSRARRNPSRLRRTTTRVASSLLVVLAPVASHAADAQAGHVKAAACAVCHGPLGISQQPDVPHLAGQPEMYVAEQLKAYRSGKRVHEVMGVVAKGLSDADIADLAAWFATIEVRPAGKN
ncbi:MAG: cytochrome c [candidate division NC10 bacterium]|nr:cytochrome c [candidate division NC10 bacterium]